MTILLQMRLPAYRCKACGTDATAPPAHEIHGITMHRQKPYRSDWQPTQHIRLMLIAAAIPALTRFNRNFARNPVISRKPSGSVIIHDDREKCNSFFFICLAKFTKFFIMLCGNNSFPSGAKI